MVIIVREDLGMRPGKVATQAAHSCVGLFNKLHVKRQGIAQAWMVRIVTWLSFHFN
jgi:peptidyl-tRNA hydrolase